MTTRTTAPEQTKVSHATTAEVIAEEPVRIDPLEGYRVAAQQAAEAGVPFQAFDQRTGKLVTGGGNPTAAQRQAELRGVDEAQEFELDKFMETIQLAVGALPAIASQPGAYDQRKADAEFRAALGRLANQSDDVDRAELARRALARLDLRSGIVKRGTGGVW